MPKRYLRAEMSRGSDLQIIYVPFVNASSNRNSASALYHVRGRPNAPDNLGKWKAV